MTMHASKGLEFQHVYLPDLNEGIIPPKGVVDAKQIEEERRLLYVAVTRAREKLFLYETRERNRKVTRFLGFYRNSGGISYKTRSSAGIALRQ